MYITKKLDKFQIRYMQGDLLQTHQSKNAMISNKCENNAIKCKVLVHYQCREMNPLIGRKYNWPSISTGSSSLDSTKPWLTEYADARSPDTQGWLFYAILYKGLTWASVDLGICTVPGTNSPVDIKEQLYTRPLKTWVWIMQVHLYPDFILNNYSTMFMFCS